MPSTSAVCHKVRSEIIPGNKDPCLDDTIPFYEHHILGTLDEFKEQNETNLQSKVGFFVHSSQFIVSCNLQTLY